MKNNLNIVKFDRKKKPRYHHGDLREALITAASELLAERGVDGFSLREAARRTGVSPGAPAYHFGDTKGLLTAVAARGFRRLAKQLETAIALAPDNYPLQAISRAYLEFATANAAIFTIMWMRDLLDQSDAEYLAAGRVAFNLFEQAVTGVDVPVATAPRTPNASLIAIWSTVHGLARLTIDGALDGSAPGLLDDILDLIQDR